MSGLSTRRQRRQDALVGDRDRVQTVRGDITGVAMKMFTLAAIAASVLALCSCSKLREIASDGEALAVAQDALAEAQKANRAIDDGTSSGSTMGDEIEAAHELAEQATAELNASQQRIAELESRVAEVESRLAAICSNAPNACY